MPNKRVTSSRSSRRSASVAVPVVANPYPSPSTFECTCEKPDSNRLGIHFRWGGGKGGRVVITGICDDSPLKESAIQVGQTVLAINGRSAETSSQVANLIRASPSQVTVTTYWESPPTHPYCKVYSIPNPSKHPGISVSSTRGRCLVQVSRVFRKGPLWGSGVSPGDVLLAINGTPVSKPEQADQALQSAARDPYVLLYVLDMSEYRSSIAVEMQTAPQFAHSGLIPGKDKLEVLLARQDEICANLHFDTETQLLVDTVPYMRLAGFAKHDNITVSNKVFHKTYRKFVVPFMTTFNEGMNRRMKVLEETVCCEAWQHSWASENENSNMVVSDSEGSSAPMSEVSCDELSNVSQNSEEPMAAVDAVAVARVEALPFECLQSYEERCASS